MADVLQFPLPLPLVPCQSQPDASATEVPDQAARESALDITASWIVEAPAGSGKTGLLMQRFLRLLAGPAVSQPEEVLAITFTRKATAELRARVLDQLQAASSNTPLSEDASSFDRATRDFARAALARDAELGWNLLRNPNRLRVRTIDSLCAEIANTLPLLSGGSAGRTPVEDAGPLYRLAARRTLMHLGGSDTVLHHAIRTVMMHRDGNLADCEALLAGMLKRREQWAELVPLDRSLLEEGMLEAVVRPRLEGALEHIVCAGLTRAMEALPSGTLHDLAVLARELSIEPGYEGDVSPIAFCADLLRPPEARANQLDHWVALINLLLTEGGSWRRGFNKNHLGFELPPSAKPRLMRIITSLSTEEIRDALCEVRGLPSARYPDDQWVVTKALFRLLLHALAELKVLFAERGECDFAELALAAREALETESGAADLAASAGITLRHLLVDEMQDTSSAQYQLLELLTRSWDGHSQTLFLVGDPKQSIYLFRQARVERFLRTMDKHCLGDVPMQPLRLTANFRSRAELVQNFNADFSRIFPAPEQARAQRDNGDVPFVAASAIRARNAADGIVWHTDVFEKPHSDGFQEINRKRGHSMEEAREIRRVVEEWRAKPLPPNRTGPWRIAVLARARKHLAPIVAEFQRSGPDAAPIPFRAVKVEALRERQEVLDLLALARALLHPADRAAWLAVLHAPWCGLGLADLLALAGEGATQSAGTARSVTIPSLITDRSHLLSADGQALLSRAWRVLQHAEEEAGRTEISALVERTWRSLGGDVMLRPEQLINARRFLALLRKTAEGGSRIDLRALNIQLGQLYAEPSAADDAVDLMTIHTAKGLEWDVVLVPALEKQEQISRSELLNWLEMDFSGSDSATVVLAPIQRKGEQSTKLYQWLSGMNKSREKAERKRLLYVACTRAREELHLFGACEQNAAGELKPRPGTLLESYWPAAQEHFASANATSPLMAQLTGSLFELEDDASGGLALAASVEVAANPPQLKRLPLSYDPAKRFSEAAKHRLPYPTAPSLQPVFERPQGSFAVRAYGNVVHRFLQLLASRMDQGASADSLLRELQTWQPRLHAGLRAEGLPPTLCVRESTRALAVLNATLNDPEGRWILSPKVGSSSETSLTLSEADRTATVRVDRIFLAGEMPLQTGGNTLWIVDFKTTEQGSRSSENFAAEEREKYGPQLARYAQLLHAGEGHGKAIRLGLYYPAVPRLIHWPAWSFFLKV